MRAAVLTGPLVCAFVVTVGFVAVPCAALQSRNFSDLAGLITAFRRGDAVNALAEFTTWDATRVAREYEAWDSQRIAGQRFLPAGTDTPDTATLVLLHTLAAMQSGEFRASSLARGGTSHYQSALRLMKTLVPAQHLSRTDPARGKWATDPELHRFCRDWYTIATALWLSARQCFQAARTAQEGLTRLGTEADLLLAAGSVAESQMGPFEDGTQLEPSCAEAWGPSQFTRRGLLLIHTRSRETAQDFLERAVLFDSSLAEAHLRLGRVYFWADRQADAQRELERAVTSMNEAEHAFVGYLAALFLGQLHEEAHRIDEARTAYEQAITFNRGGSAAHIALGHLLLRSGADEEGWARVRAALDSPHQNGLAEIDPWVDYRNGQSWLTLRRVEALAAWVQR